MKYIHTEQYDDAVRDVISKLVESETMRNYLLENAQNLQDRQILDLICGSRTALKRKIRLLKKLAAESGEEENEPGGFRESADYGRWALRQLKAGPGEVFLGIEYGAEPDGRTEQYGSEPFFRLRDFWEAMKLDGEDGWSDTAWCSIEKYVPEESGRLARTLRYIVSPAVGEIWFFDEPYPKKHGSIDIIPFSDSRHLNLPVPFCLGDIITVDCRPFAPVRHGVILEVGDNIGCYCVQCLYQTKSGLLQTGALKHGSLFSDTQWWPEVSPLYRAELVQKPLPKEERALERISDFVGGGEKRSAALWQFLYETDKTGRGIPLSVIENEFFV